MDDLSRERLSVLHHLLGCDVVDSAAAEEFSHVLGALLLEQRIISATTTCSGPHWPRPTESALKNLSRMKNSARKFIHHRCDEFLNLVRAHHTVKKISFYATVWELSFKEWEWVQEEPMAVCPEELAAF